MPPPIVYIVPNDFIGPVFVFFGQKDGITPSADILGRSVLIPKNGVIKIKQDVGDVIAKQEDGKQNMYWVEISKSGIRKKLILNDNTQQEKNGDFYENYYDENGLPHKYPVIEKNHPFYYFSESQRKEKMIFGHEGCQHQFLEKNTESTEKPPACAKFLVISPNQFLTMPRWMWNGINHPYSSISEFEETANERVLMKENFYQSE
ncbi:MULTISPECIES: hypothetical protein [unclassified Janthinobacterium]|uniref:hypothetical protein n=1 Tax=unclassified Janthinobacterium TaxID=2610881 RepID=UPI0018DED043|nr:MULTISPECIES: hypothetical protein [unclassified Janthinobacterium]